MKDSANTESIKPQPHKISEILKFIIPGASITFKGNAKSFIVEKVNGNEIILSYHHFSDNKIRNINSLDNVVYEKFPININQLDREVTNIFMPKWAKHNIEEINKINVETTVKSKVSKYSSYDSQEAITEIANFIKNKYNVKVNFIDNLEAQKYGEELAAFVKDGEIFINTDKASIEEPLHELLHLVLMTLKSKNRDSYYVLVNSVKNHPLFEKVSENYSDSINIEKLEETFVKLLSQTFRTFISRKGIFSQDVFDSAIKEAISELLQLSDSLDFEDSFDLLESPVEQIMTLFGSNILNNAEGLIDQNSVMNMLRYSGMIKELIENGNLREECK